MTPFRLRLGDLFWKHLIRPELFRYDGETAHQIVVTRLSRWQTRDGFLRLLRWLYESPYIEQPINVGGVIWRNPVGLAGGFDKQGQIIPALDALGFGNAEIGTVTPRPQPGNERPRVWRRPDTMALVNRYGFPSDGAECLAECLRDLHGRYHIRMSLTVSAGANKNTPPQNLVDDYAEVYRLIRPLLRPYDVFKVNVSSPNTPHLRDVFSDIRSFLRAFYERITSLPWALPRLYFKVPPDDMSHRHIIQAIEAAADFGFSAIEATNTTLNAELLRQLKIDGVAGVSGAPLFGPSNTILHQLREPARSRGIDLIGVGGIMSGRNARTKKHIGAKAVQIYTGLVYAGPGLIHDILESWEE